MPAPRIFDVSHERAARPQSVRDEVPYPQHMAQFRFGSQYGPTIAPYVSDMQVLGLPAAWRAVNRVANGVAAMAPLEVIAPDGFTRLPSPPIASRPDAGLTSYVFWHQAVSVALMRGNYLGILADFDGNGYPRQAVSVPPELVDCHYNAAGFTEYHVGGQVYSPLDVVHVPAFLLPGTPWGVGPVELFRRGLTHALEQQHLAADTYSRGSVPSGVIATDRSRLDKTQAEEVQAQWIERHGAQRRPAVLPQGWSFTPLSWSPEDAQFLESRQFTVAEIALMFGLDPSDLSASFGGGPSITYANVEQREITRITDAYGPWMRRFEEAWSDLIPGGNKATFNPNNLLRMDAKTQAEVDSTDIASKVVEVNEARARRGLPPLSEEKLRPPTPPALPAPPTGAQETTVTEETPSND